jgi:hypothetical protein
MGAAPNPVRSARRKTELHERLGSEDPVCFYCGFAVVVALRRFCRKCFEEHHPEGCNHDPNSTIFVCRNCHAVIHELLLDDGVNLKTISDPIGRVAAMLRAEAVHFEAMARTKRMQAEWLEMERS